MRNHTIIIFSILILFSCRKDTTVPTSIEESFCFYLENENIYDELVISESNESVYYFNITDSFNYSSISYWSSSSKNTSSLLIDNNCSLSDTFQIISTSTSWPLGHFGGTHYDFSSNNFYLMTTNLSYPVFYGLNYNEYIDTVGHIFINDAILEDTDSTHLTQINSIAFESKIVQKYLKLNDVINNSSDWSNSGINKSNYYSESNITSQFENADTTYTGYNSIHKEHDAISEEEYNLGENLYMPFKFEKLNYLKFGWIKLELINDNYIYTELAIQK